MRRLGWPLALLLGTILPLGSPSPALAQGQVEIKAPSPERPPRPEFIIPGQPPEVTRPREQEFYPDRIRSRHDPAFIVPFSTTVSTGPRTVGRFGLSLWTAPQGRGDTPWAAREIGGWLGFGFSFVWDIPAESETAR